MLNTLWRRWFTHLSRHVVWIVRFYVEHKDKDVSLQPPCSVLWSHTFQIKPSQGFYWFSGKPSGSSSALTSNTPVSRTSRSSAVATVAVTWLWRRDVCFKTWVNIVSCCLKSNKDSSSGTNTNRGIWRREQTWTCCRPRVNPSRPPPPPQPDNTAVLYVSGYEIWIEDTLIELVQDLTVVHSLVFWRGCRFSVGAVEVTSLCCCLCQI